VNLSGIDLESPEVRTFNPDGHEVIWETQRPSPGFICGWLTLTHGTGPKADSTGRHFVRLPH
jgi:hypothetical protein